jgi:uncharacterized protein YceH (UPF0502 family)
MEISLSDIEARVLGCLMEKQMATPDLYPLSLNAITNACNQKTNRQPVVSYDGETVEAALRGLREYQMVRQSKVGRVPKYEQVFSQASKLVVREEAILCILLLRGPQTVGEIRSRTERLYGFSDLEEVQEAITSLENMALVKKLPRQPGRKECRYVHLLSPASQETLFETGSQADVGAVVQYKADDHDRTRELQEQIDELRRELHDLRADFIAFKSEFGE